MRNKNTSIELIDSHVLENALRAFSNKHRMDLVAVEMGCGKTVALNKYNPDSEFHQLTVNNLISSAIGRNDASVIEAIVKSIGFEMFKPMCAQTACIDGLLRTVLKAQGSAGHICDIYQQAIADEELDENEKTELLACIGKTIGHLSELASGIKCHAAISIGSKGTID